MRFGKLSVIFVLSLVVTAAILSSCAGTKKQKAACALSDVLRGNYVCELNFNVRGKEQYSGKAEITKSGTVTRLDILSPEPYSGMSIEYDTAGLPSSVAVHFSGMSTLLPSDAVARINPIASLFADDFASCLGKVSKDDITEYELEDRKGLCASLLYSDARIIVYFSETGSVPYSLEYESDDMQADIVFDVFKAQVIDLTE